MTNSLSYYRPIAILFVLMISVKKEADSNNEEGVKVKEHAIMELGTLLAATGQAEGRQGQGPRVSICSLQHE